MESGRFYSKAVLWAVEQGITKGITETTFEPDTVCTRGQAVTLIWRAYGKPAPTNGASPFVDVNVNSFCGQAVLWAAEHGVTTGYDATHFLPNKICNRAQIVTFLWRAAGRP